jgi:hypothetical protein
MQLVILGLRVPLSCIRDDVDAGIDLYKGLSLGIDGYRLFMLNGDALLEIF